MKDATGANPDDWTSATSAPLGYAPGRLSLGYQPVEIWGISPWRQQPVSNHKTTISSLRDSEPLFRQPARVVCVRAPALSSAPISRALGTLSSVSERTPCSMEAPARVKIW